MNTKWLQFGIIAGGLMCMTLAQAKTLTIIKDKTPVATIEIAADTPVTIFGERSEQSQDGKVMHYSGQVRAEIQGQNKPIVLQADEVDLGS